jgi:hypothetical protein
MRLGAKVRAGVLLVAAVMRFVLVGDSGAGVNRILYVGFIF